MSGTVKYILILALLFVARHSKSQKGCPPKTGKQEQATAYPVFGTAFHYCVDEIRSLSVKNENIYGKWEVTQAKRKNYYYKGKTHRHPIIENYHHEIDGIRGILFKNDRTATYKGDSAVEKRMSELIWAFPKTGEKLRGYGSLFTSDSTNYKDLNFKDDIYIFSLYGTALLNMYVFEVRKITRKKLVLGTQNGRKIGLDLVITLRKIP